jgi:hypothetical protein
MKTLIVWIVTVLLFPLLASAQVDEIKRASSSKNVERSRSSSSSSSSSSSISGEGVSAFFEVTFYGIVAIAAWQDYTLEKRVRNPSLVSVDVMLQVASQPSNYYVVNPRIRGNWGLFSTDFRFNYLIEQDFDGMKHIRTEDWQILELNVLTMKNFTGRIGGGILHEDFSGGKTVSEWTTALNALTNNEKFGGMFEFRWSEPRTEASAQLQYRLFSTKSLHTYLTSGVVFQQYYEKINVWGVQLGLTMRIYR